MRDPTQKTEEEGHTSGRHIIRRKASLDKTNRFLEMLKGYGIKVEIDEKTREPKITDDIIKQLEKKSKGKISDVLEPMPGVKFTEKIPLKGQDRVKENGLFMTQYDTQTGFPRITKEMYKKVKEKNPIISKEKVEEEVSKHNISALAAQQNNNYYPESRDDLENDFKPLSQNRNLPPSSRGQLLKPIVPKDDKKTKEGVQPMFLTFAAGPTKPILAKQEPVKVSSMRTDIIEGSRRTHNENKSVVEVKDQVIEPRASSVPRPSERIKPKSQAITKRTWRLKSAQRRDKSLIMPRGKNDSFDMVYLKIISRS